MCACYEISMDNSVGLYEFSSWRKLFVLLGTAYAFDFHQHHYEKVHGLGMAYCLFSLALVFSSLTKEDGSLFALGRVLRRNYSEACVVHNLSDL